MWVCSAALVAGSNKYQRFILTKYSCILSIWNAFTVDSLSCFIICFWVIKSSQNQARPAMTSFAKCTVSNAGITANSFNLYLWLSVEIKGGAGFASVESLLVHVISTRAHNITKLAQSLLKDWFVLMLFCCVFSSLLCQFYIVTVGCQVSAFPILPLVIFSRASPCCFNQIIKVYKWFEFIFITEAI